MKLLVYSNSDLAGINIAAHLMHFCHFKDSEFNSLHGKTFGEFFLVGVNQALIDLEISSEDVEWALMLSRHRSASGKRCLTAHTSGNPGKSADLGGKPSSVAISNPALQSSLLRELRQSVADIGIGLQVTVEATHHGPTELPFPVTFVEIGSDEGAWMDELLGRAVAAAVLRSIKRPPGEGKKALGVGGGHYSEKFTSLMLSSDYHIGHIIPKYVMGESFDTGMIKTCLDRTSGGCSCIIADWKGTPSEVKEYLRSFSRSFGTDLVRL